MTPKELGELGELYARQYLEDKKFKIITTNYRFHRNEIDIICCKNDKIVFVEVKTRQTSEIGPPWKAVTKSKQAQIIKCAHHYICSNNINKEAQFDIISVVHNSYGTSIEHIEDAFYPKL